MGLKNNIEGILIKWGYQVSRGENGTNLPFQILNQMFKSQTEEVLGKDSAAELEDGKTPGPLTEIQFWEAKCLNLESLFEQVGK